MIPVEIESVPQYDRAEQARLAVALVDSLGLERAILACHTGGWHGVLDFLVAGGREARWRTAVAARSGAERPGTTGSAAMRRP